MGELAFISPHHEGTIRCLACKHHWEGIAPFGLVDLKCPKCGCARGAFYRPLAPNTRFQCLTCESILFFIAPTYIKCAQCGKMMDYPDDGGDYEISS